MQLLVPRNGLPRPARCQKHSSTLRASAEPEPWRHSCTHSRACSKSRCFLADSRLTAFAAVSIALFMAPRQSTPTIAEHDCPRLLNSCTPGAASGCVLENLKAAETDSKSLWRSASRSAASRPWVGATLLSASCTKRSQASPPAAFVAR